VLNYYIGSAGATANTSCPRADAGFKGIDAGCTQGARGIDAGSCDSAWVHGQYNTESWMENT
jgi:hypothetical protein